MKFENLKKLNLAEYAKSIGDTVSPDGRQSSLLFNGLGVVLDGKNPDLRKSLALELRIPVTLGADEPFFGFLQQIRGCFIREAGMWGSIYLHAGGVSRLFEFPGDVDNIVSEEGEGPQPLVTNFFREYFSVVNRPPKKDSPLLYFDVDAYEALLVITLERRTPKVQGQLIIDSLDVTAVCDYNSPPATPQKQRALVKGEVVVK